MTDLSSPRLGLVLRRSLAACTALAIATTPVPALAGPGGARTNTIPAPVQTAKRPNILFILVDDMGFSDLSIMGNKKVQTPNIDRIAREGVLMTQFYDPAPICSASRAGFFTGRFPAEVNFLSYIAGRESNRALGQADWLDPKMPNIARMLKGAGYATAHIGKWHMGGGRDIGDAPRPTDYGFDRSFTTFEGLGPRVLVSDEERDLAEQSDRLGNGPRFWEIKTKLTGLYCDMAVNFIGEHSEEPWFVNLWLNDVHDPWAPGDDALRDVMGRGDSSDDDRMLATLVKMDKTLGRLFERLEQMGEMDNTLIVFTSDNGPLSLQRYYQGGKTAPGSVGTLRGRKWSNYEGGIRQPMILYWRGQAQAGYRDERTVGHGVDLLPTLAAIVGAKVPADVDGVDLSPVLRGQPIAERPALYWGYGKEGASKQPPQPHLPHDAAPPFAIRDGNWKLFAGMGGANPQLYDLAADPGETTDLATTQPGVRDRLLAKLKTWMQSLPK
ncbi:sulfatase-like hydrolase/transferase [Sphingomonas sp. M1-B02]|uniref:sulfatase-like hydrolase/transferase n=1 Tax=Sphingomonas sp. M1-B02 TaxID=3114300 RepID=UPI00223EA842|nr:sulfatase-like hydrolase/transferase [Sphingomonas sp. S6-11]UZK67687.1 sulfatase-like hydrolase/transferase [Sphingomonas sp. S6-11]